MQQERSQQPQQSQQPQESQESQQSQQSQPERLPYARSFKELIVYRKARKLAREVFEATKKFPREEAYSLTDQWRRAARSVGAQIAEAWAKRRYPRHFVSKLSDADGEQLETQHWTISAFDCKYIDRDETRRLGMLALEIGRILGEMIENPERFCHADRTPALHEDAVSYFSDPDAELEP